jgi:hypothetical protein
MQFRFIFFLIYTIKTKAVSSITLLVPILLLDKISNYPLIRLKRIYNF